MCADGSIVATTVSHGLTCGPDDTASQTGRLPSESVVRLQQERAPVICLVELVCNPNQAYLVVIAHRKRYSGQDSSFSRITCISPTRVPRLPNAVQRWPWVEHREAAAYWLVTWSSLICYQKSDILQDRCRNPIRELGSRQQLEAKKFIMRQGGTNVELLCNLGVLVSWVRDERSPCSTVHQSTKR